MTIWDIANSNLVILLIGSGLGFIFVRLVWEPYKQRQEENSRRRTMRDEADFRLATVESQVAYGETSFNTQINGGRDTGLSLDPRYGTWSLDGLIFAGWGKDVFNKCYPHILKLKEAGNVKSATLAQAEITILKIILQR